MPHSASAGIPLSRQEIDRDGLGRARPALFDELWLNEHTRVLALWRGRTLIRDLPPSEAGAAVGFDVGTAPLGLELLPVANVAAALIRVYLGRTVAASPHGPAGTAVVVEVLTDAAATELEPDETRWMNLRRAAPQLSNLDAGLFTEAVAIANWHDSHPCCPRCGNPTVVEQGGWVRRCFVDNSEVFPRTDPAIIVAIHDDDDRILLGSNAAWEPGRYSLLAGFVEPGESFEEAIAREIGEEAGISVVDPEYLGSQPWPFPASVMVGFRVRLAADQDPSGCTPDGEEIVSLRWFTRDELRSDDSVILPGAASIARAVIEDWLAS
ncbi:MAG: NAD(+) diphosphatase [Microbacteriaceae bacterium]